MEPLNTRTLAIGLTELLAAQVTFDRLIHGSANVGPVDHTLLRSLAMRSCHQLEYRASLDVPAAIDLAVEATTHLLAGNAAGVARTLGRNGATT